ncbi:uncharacterized protein [Haliotis asinina]|uniref:uncharacterized protein n=1 Tax=Haliotis asinina TaxID=109174 RepID=UPI003531C0D0
MMKSVIVWIYVTYLCCLLQPFCTGTTYTSKVCYGSDLPCTQHHLSCNSTQKIGIHDAYYTNNSDCTVEGISNCVNFSADGVTEYGYHRFNNAELVSLYEHCSTKVQCVYRAPRRSAALAFSVVKYRCIEENIPESPKIKSTHNSLAPGTTDNNNTAAGEITTRPNKDELPKSTPSFPAGVFMGGVAAGAVIVILVGLAVFVLVIRRRYDLTAKKKGETPASVEHPTYSGLSAGTDANNYSMIEQTSRSQENTTHGPTGTTDYQNI